MNVKDIYGASPSVAQENMKNIMRAKEHLKKNPENNRDYLGQYERLFQLKQIHKV